MPEGKLATILLAFAIGAAVGGTIVYTILTLQAIQRAQKLIKTSSVIFDRDAQGRTSAIHYASGSNGT
jgi:hypothetical protein